MALSTDLAHGKILLGVPMNSKKETKLELIKCIIIVECGRHTSFSPG